ncbi:MAG: LytTR family DNA-binding domain-containing protein [Eubacterium sp.]
MIKIYLCDDNEIILEKYETLIKHIAIDHQLDVKVLTFISGEQLLFQVEENIDDPDIIYLDILMGRLNGIDTAKKLRQKGCKAEIIFLTSSEEYVFESFDITPFHYILKEETDEDKFADILLKAVAVKDNKEKNTFIFKSGQALQKVYLEDICYFEITNRIVTLHKLGGEKIEFYQAMDKLEEELSAKGFVRTQRSFMVNLRYVDRIEKDAVHLSEGDMVPVGAKYIQNLKIALSKYLLQQF